MNPYFNDQDSMAILTGDRVEESLGIIATRYAEQNPCAPVTFRAYPNRGILRGPDNGHHADFEKMFPDARDEQCTFSWSRIWSPEAAESTFEIRCFGPIVLYLNGEKAWRSDIFCERYPHKGVPVTLPLQKGWNHIVIRATKTRAGFGWNFGSGLPKWPRVFMMPSTEREGQEGWLYTDPGEATLPGDVYLWNREDEAGINWLPETGWPKEQARRGALACIFGNQPGHVAIGWTKVVMEGPNSELCRIQGSHQGSTRAFMDDREVLYANGSGSLDGEIEIGPGEHALMVVAECDGDNWGVQLTIHSASNSVKMQSPCNLQGSDDPWIYTGPFDTNDLPDMATLRDLFFIHGTTEGPSYWRVNSPDTWVRIYNENPLFGRWNYPLGVTIYGLLHTALTLDNANLREYVAAHVQRCSSTFAYALWDHAQFGGFTHVHHHLTSIDSLDDCGSFGSCMLEVARNLDIKSCRTVADYVAEYIHNRQERFPDGAFFRRETAHPNTMWADDLYMSVPFLCRYYQLTGKTCYLDDAANQFIGFRKRLFMPEVKLMAHVYDLNLSTATEIPWGRGNGWVLFSLSELLEVLPENHTLRSDLLNFFHELCDGVLPLQDKDGMWRQVLTHLDSYPETSCTAMFIYAFSRGIRMGWLDQTKGYADAAQKAWEGLTRISIDRDGNIHGVCQGSGFSFTPDYYKYDLPPRLNDTHGIGIVLLAGIEICKLRQHLKSEKTDQTGK